MSKLGGLLGRKPSPVAAEEPAGLDEPETDILEVDQDLFSPFAQLGEENEAVRNLLADAEYKISELDAIKNAFGKLVDPVSKTLLSYEVEKREKLTLQNALTNTRAVYGQLRSDYATIEKKATTLENECARLQGTLTAAQQGLSALESVKNEQAAELGVRRARINDLQWRLQQESVELQTTRDENRRLGERVTAADKLIVQLEAESESTRIKLTLTEKERAGLQSSLEQALNESARMSRRLVEADNALAAAHARLRQMESGLTESETDRTRLTVALDETNERHLTELNNQRARYEALQVRATTTERLLDEARQMMAARAEELRSLDRRFGEATNVRGAMEGKLGQVEAALAERETELKNLEQAHAALADRNEALTKAVHTRDRGVRLADAKIQAMEDRIMLLEGELRSTQQAAEQRIEDLSAHLQREKLDRAMAEGALEAGRKDVARLLRELTLQNRTIAAADPDTRANARYRDAA
jgi:chromosome segregation ATPase